jgi:hypothetical protein
LSDLPVYLGRLTGLTWVGNGSLKNRVMSLGYYLRGAFLARGMGLIVLGLSLAGYTVVLQRRPRQALFLTVLAILHLLAITPTVFRLTRHALVLYPLAAIFAAVGLDFAQERLASLLVRYQATRDSLRPLVNIPPEVSGLLVFLLFLAVSMPKMLQTASYVGSMYSFKPSQVRMAEFVRANLPEGTKVGLLEVVPFANGHLRWSGADVDRVGLHVTMDELRQGGFEYVIGTNLLGSAFEEGQNTIWVSDLLSDQERIVALGTDGLSWRGWPVGNILLYLSRVPPLEAEP